MSAEGETRRVGERGQVTIPQRLRREQNIQSGDELEFILRGDEIVIRPRVTDDDLVAAYQRTARRDADIAEEMNETSQEANADLGDAPSWE